MWQADLKGGVVDFKVLKQTKRPIGISISTFKATSTIGPLLYPSHFPTSLMLESGSVFNFTFTAIIERKSSEWVGI